MNLFGIFKKKKEQVQIRTNYVHEREKEIREQKIRDGVASLMNGKELRIACLDRGHSLALEIKERFLEEHRRRILSKIKIEVNGHIVSIIYKPN